jgi:excisionase family DNA binding protein
VDAERPNYRKAIDDALLLVYSHHHRLMSRLHPDTVGVLDIEDLRAGPMGQDLGKLSAIAEGETREPKERVLEAIDSVLQMLFWPPGADTYQVPRSFWETDLGRMISMAKFRSYEPADLVSIGNAAQQLGVTRPTIYRWMDDRTLGYVRDEMSGRTFVVRDDVEFLRQQSPDEMLESSP